MNAFEVIGSYVLKGADKAGRQIQGMSDRGGKSAGMIDKAAVSLDSFGKGVSATGDKMSKWVTGPLAAAGIGIAALTTKAAAATKEIENYSRLTGETVENFQAQAFAADTVGIEMDKYGDILKDVQDRVGDFVATGAGPMADFFENIGPKVGVTAENFRGLGGKDALQLYVRSLERANVSSQEMTFYMETLAGDASKLIPLFAENGKQLNSLADQARDAGLVMSSEMIEGSKDGRQALKILSASFDALINKIGVSLLPVMESIVPVMTGVVIPAIDNFGKVLGALVDTFNMLPDPIKGLIAGIVGFVGVVGPVLSIVGRLISMFSKFAPLLGILKVGFGLLAAVSAPFIGTALAIAAAVGAIYAAVTNWSAITEFAQNVWAKFTAFMEETFGGLGGRILNAIKAMPGQIMDFFRNLGASMVNWASSVVGNIVGRFREMISFITGAQAQVAGAQMPASPSSPMWARGDSGGVSSRSGMAGGASAGNTYVDMRNSTFRDDKDMLDRIRRQGKGLTGGSL